MLLHNAMIFQTNKERVLTAEIKSPLGNLTAGATPAGILFLLFGGLPNASSEKRAAFDEKKLQRLAQKKAAPHKQTGEPQEYLNELKLQLSQYFAGERKIFSLPLDWRGTDFQINAWSTLCKVPWGQTISYEEEARRMGSPRAIRAAASSNAANPIPIVVPCHRVISKNGSLGGYSGGLERKEFLLALENVRLR